MKNVEKQIINKTLIKTIKGSCFILELKKNFVQIEFFQEIQK